MLVFLIPSLTSNAGQDLEGRTCLCGAASTNVPACRVRRSQDLPDNT